MRQRLPGALAVVLTSVGVISSLAAVAAGIVYTFSDFARGLPGYPQLFRETARGIRKFLPSELNDTVTDSLALAARGLASQVVSIALTLTFMVMIIAESETWRSGSFA